MEELIFKAASGQGLYALLFVGFLVYYVKATELREERWIEHNEKMSCETRVLHNESRERERELMGHNRETLAALDNLSRSNKEIVESMKNLERQTAEGFDKLWERIEERER